MSVIRHILLLQPGQDTTEEQIDAAKRAITGLKEVIPGILDVHWGQNVAALERQAGFSHAFSMDFADAKSLADYGPHPEHQRAAALVRAAFARIVVLDLPLT
jgi:hypothetical protein